MATVKVRDLRVGDQIVTDTAWAMQDGTPWDETAIETIEEIYDDDGLYELVTNGPCTIGGLEADDEFERL